MDTFSHALWGKGLFGYKKYRYLPFLFGAAPDLFAFIPNLFFKIFKGNFSFGKPEVSSIPDWVMMLYNFGHSFITAFFVVFFLYLIGKKMMSYAALAWPFHIMLDFPFHTKEFFPTKIFYPISDFHFDGISWASPEVWFTNIALLVLIFVYRYVKN